MTKTTTKSSTAAKKFIPSTAYKMIKEIIWTKVPAKTWFTAKVGGKKITGQIQKRYGVIFLCSSDAAISSHTDNGERLGYRYCMSIGAGDYRTILGRKIKDLSLLPSMPKGFKKPTPLPIVDGRSVEYRKGKVIILGRDVPNSVILETVKRLTD